MCDRAGEVTHGRNACCSRKGAKTLELTPGSDGHLELQLQATQYLLSFAGTCTHVARTHTRVHTQTQ